MTDILSSKGADNSFAARPGADIIVGGGVEDAPRPDAADSDSAPGRGRGYVVEGEAGLDWLFGGAPDETPAPGAPLDIVHPVFHAAPADDEVDPVFMHRRRQRRRPRRRF